MRHKILVLALALVLTVGLGSWLYAADAAPPKAGEPDDGIMGEYAGAFTPAGQNAGVTAEAKVVGEGGGSFRAVLSAEGDKKVKLSLTGKAEGQTVALAGKVGDVEWKGTIEGARTLTAESKDGKFDLKFTVRKSPTEGQKPPAGALILLPMEEGKAPSTDAWQSMDGKPCPWIPLDSGAVQVRGGNIQTKKSFGNMKLHAEFRVPYMPAARGQGRGNSGVYLQSRYEVQVLDSFGLESKDNECGGIYSVGAPKTIASLPPGRWQTYDITFTTPEVKDGKITKPAVMSVVHNGIAIHENVKIDHVTTAGVGGPIVAPAPLMLQDHGNPVQYRNIWIVEQKD